MHCFSILSFFTLRSCLLLALAIHTSLGICQEIDYKQTNIIPPSPTAASLGIYGDTPVSSFNGTATVDIPLLEIQSGDIKLPVALSYLTSGIKVQQDASWVGLGWSLSCGGVITRTIRGLDDFPYNGYYNLPALPSCDENNNPNTGNRDYQFYFDLNNGHNDGEPDIFYYNFHGYTGKFILQKRALGGNVFISTQDNLRFTIEGNGQSWMVQTPDGFIYKFQTQELSKTYSNPSELMTYSGIANFPNDENECITAWYLDEIISPSNRSVKFEYAGGESLSTIACSQTRFDFLHLYFSDPYEGVANFQTNYFSNSRQWVKEKYLKRIVFDTGDLLFHLDTRADIEPAPPGANPPLRLSSIELRNSKGGTLKRINLNYSYFQGNTPPRFENRMMPSYSKLRLKLDEIEDTQGKHYRFIYYKPLEISNKYSRAVDLWGNYSGEQGNGSILPGEHYNATLLAPYVYNKTVDFPGNTRMAEATGEYAKRGSLIAVEYPTGGICRFEYEPNQITTTVSEENTWIKSVWSRDEYEPNVDKSYKLSETFTLTKPMDVQLICGASTLDGTTITEWQIYGYLTGPVNKTFANENHLQKFTLPAGTYTLRTDIVANYNVYIDLRGSTGTTTKTVNQSSAGLRIKRIANYDTDGNLLSGKKYYYSRDGKENGLSSGVLIKRNVNAYETPIVIHKLYYWPPPFPAYVSINSFSGKYLVRVSSTATPLGFSSQGNEIGYARVQEVIEGSNGTNGSTVTYYHATPETIQGDFFPDIPTSGNYLNGKAQRVEVYDNENSQVRVIDKEYELKNEQIIKGVRSYTPPPQRSSDLKEFSIRFYDNSSQWWVLSRETVEEVMDGNSFVTEKYYRYENPVHKLLTEQEEVLSDGSLRIRRYKYPQDLLSSGNYQSMITKRFLHTPVIQESEYLNNKLIDERTVSYAEVANNVFKPLNIHDIRLGDNILLATFGNYDSYGNPGSVKIKGEPEKAYFWGYKQSLPVIEAQNITKSSLDAAVVQTLMILGETNIDTFLETASPERIQQFCLHLAAKFPLAGSIFNVYKYEPQVGILSVTDQNGKAQRFEYDGAGKLMVIKNSSGHIKNYYQYNYRH